MFEIFGEQVLSPIFGYRPYLLKRKDGYWYPAHSLSIGWIDSLAGVAAYYFVKGYPVRLTDDTGYNMKKHSELEEMIEKTRVQHGGMGSVKITFNPYECCWTCEFNWSDNRPISGTGGHLEDAIMSAIEAVKCVKSSVDNARIGGGK